MRLDGTAPISPTLVLLVPKASPLKSAADLWKQDRIGETLITVPSNEPIRRALQEGLAERRVDWLSGIEVSTVDPVQTYVIHGYGYGVTVGIPKALWHPEVRVVPLQGFPLTTFGLVWQGRKTPVLEALIAILESTVHHLLQGEDPALHLQKPKAKVLGPQSQGMDAG